MSEKENKRLPDEELPPVPDDPTDDIDEIPADIRGTGVRRCDAPKFDERNKLHSLNWLGDIPGGFAENDLVEVQFKNTRKGFYRNTTNIPLKVGDIVAVEASPGHDIGRVTLMGALVGMRMRKCPPKTTAEIKRIFRKAKPADLEKYEEAKARENDTMIRARKIAESLKLNMKIGDVEYQGDGNKAIFYYIADERVDFRQLIKVLAETFKVRIEMKQIGARQEAGRIGGIGPCGRPLCCSLWMSNFVSVATSAARFQDISLNPQKLAGQCAKLKCCLNFEVDTYVEASKKMPPRDARLETADATYYHFKSDIFNRQITYSTDKSLAANLVTISADRALDIIAMNKAGEKPLSLKETAEEKPRNRAEFGDILGEDDLTRFDKKKKKRKNKQPQAQKGPKTEGQAPKAPKSEGQAEQPKQENKGPKPQKPGEPKEQKRNKGPKHPKQANNPKKPDAPAAEGQNE